MTAIGVDIGGTHIRLLHIAPTGRILGRQRLKTRPERGVAETIAAIVHAIRQLAEAPNTGPIEAVGIGISGPIDVTTGIVNNPFTLGGWPPTDFRAPFINALGVPVVIDNDANVAALGEWWCGAGQGARRMTMVTIGTGIGVATLLNGQMQRTTDGRHGEAGHMVLNPSGEKCYCGARGCWEVLSSGTALDKKAVALVERGEGMLKAMVKGDPSLATSALLFAAAAAGDVQAQSVIDEMATWLGLGLVNLASTIMPDLFVLSGGVIGHFGAIQPEIQRVLKQHSAMIPTDVPVVAAMLGEEAGALGAAKLALDVIGSGGRLNADLKFAEH